MDLTTLAVGGVALIPLVIGLVQVLKNLGVAGNRLTYAALGIGGLVAFLYKISIMLPVTEPWVGLVVFVAAGGLAALSATGIYDLAKTWVAAIQPVSKGGPGVNIGVGIPPGAPKGVGVDAISVPTMAPDVPLSNFTVPPNVSVTPVEPLKPG